MEEWAGKQTEAGCLVCPVHTTSLCLEIGGDTQTMQAGQVLREGGQL